MNRFRIIPILLIDDDGLVKGDKFKNHKYVGDPINAVKIFNDKEVDEIAILDIKATKNGKEPQYSLIEQLAGEAFMPMSYGGGLQDIAQVSRILKSGVEKVIFNYSAVTKPDIIKETAMKFGSSSTVVSIDVKSAGLLGSKKVHILNGQKNTGIDPITFAKEVEEMGAGEIILTCIDREGSMNGYDLKLIQQICQHVQIPIVVNGGAGSLQHFKEAIQAGASAVAAGSMFVFQGARKAVLISYPSIQEIKAI